MLDFWCTNSDYGTFSPEFNHPINVYNHFSSHQKFVKATSAKTISQLPPSSRDLTLTQGTQTDIVNFTLRGRILFLMAGNHKHFLSADEQNANFSQRKILCRGSEGQGKYITEQRRKLHTEYSPKLQYFLETV
jgi:hypothetical protein